MKCDRASERTERFILGLKNERLKGGVSGNYRGVPKTLCHGTIEGIKIIESLILRRFRLSCRLINASIMNNPGY